MDFSDSNRRYLRRALLIWYDANRRDLPWRQTRDPYRIWISEIMLQQTRVAVVIDRYRQFLKRFPTLHDLARARESAVLAEWSGLGYYWRARNLRAAAKMIERKHDGILPRSADALRKLPGIGRYTAAAIASIAFDKPIAVVDGNVERVLGRLQGEDLAGESVWTAAQELLYESRPGDFNQAMMELGAAVCIPAQPQCIRCPINKFCRTRGRGKPRMRSSRQQNSEIAYLLAQRGKTVLLARRPADRELMPGMWELPEAALIKSGTDTVLFSLSHCITTTNYRVHVVGASANGFSRTAGASKSGVWVKSARLTKIPLTGLARKILKRAAII